MNNLNKLFGGMRIAATALTAERSRMDIIAQNISNAQSTRVGNSDQPYRRQVVNFAPILERATNGRSEVTGVEITKISEDFRTPFEEIYDPSHPDANAEGIVRMPNVNTVREMADLITAVRSYEANLKVQKSFEQMMARAIRLAE
ncbi:MAG: flagellar basal-body rod protein FlgC [Chlamydiales bacterium]|jgi:flagellar basal-body rod protein FlgC